MKKATIISDRILFSIGFAEQNWNEIVWHHRLHHNQRKRLALEYVLPPLLIYAVQSTASSTVLSKQTDTVLPGNQVKLK
jgi:hypothetical protein